MNAEIGTKVKSLLTSAEFYGYLIILVVCTVCAILDPIDSFSSDGWLVIGVICVMFGLLLKDRMPADFVMTLALAVLLFFNVVSIEDGLEGFSSSAVLSVAVLYGVAAGVTATGALDYFMSKLLGDPSSLIEAQLRLMVPTAIISAFMNNTPVVAILIPIVQNWVKKLNNVRQDISASQLFIPLSFASILGGTCTLIGTSTNLVVAGKALEEKQINISLFELGIVGVPVLLTGFSYIALFSDKLLPSFQTVEKRQNNGAGPDSTAKAMVDNRTRGQTIISSVFVSCVVNPSSPVVGKTVSKALLRRLNNGLFLSSVQRKSEVFQAVGPEFVIQAFDVLYFSGVVSNFVTFCYEYDFTPVTEEDRETGVIMEPIEGEAPTRRRSRRESPDFSGSNSDVELDPCVVPKSKLKVDTFDSRIIRVLVRSTGKLPKKTVKDIRFRETYQSAILSINRWERGKVKKFSGSQLGGFFFRTGDELVILLNDNFSWTIPEVERDLKPSQTRKDNSSDVAENDALMGTNIGSIEREFLLSMRVADASRLPGTKSLIGQTIEQAGLRGLPGLFLIALERDENVINAVSSKRVLQKDDVLWFIGERDSVSTLRKIPGLESPTHVNYQVNKLKLLNVERRLVECVISMNSDMLGKTIKEARFRSRYRAAVVAVHREGQRVLKTIGEIELRAGDVLILDTGSYFIQRFRNDPNFLLVAEIENSEVPQFTKFYIALLSLIGMMVLVTAFEVNLVVAAVFCLAILLYFRILTPQRARNSINWGVIITIACAFGLSSALENSKVAETVGKSLVSLADLSGTGQLGILTSVYFATVLLSIVIANNAAALLMFPIAVQATDGLGLPESETQDFLIRVLYVLMLAASSSFSTPFGYQTNLMVYGPGNYLFKDFLIFGLPMQLWQMVFSVLFVHYVDYYYVAWAVSLITFIAVVLFKRQTSQTEIKVELNEDDLEKNMGGSQISIPATDSEQ